MKTKGFSNSLIDETSPYLLQHAHNPVHWYAWNKLAFEKAKNEDKLVLISIGYSACHWCHVMEHECFEDLEVAEIMNKHFVCIKVDREERPDVDQVYMNAVQLMTQRGGWPLNCFTLPDGRPIYGGTYFPKNHWINVLNSLQDTFENDREKVLEYATKLTQGVRLSEHPILDIEKVPNESILNNAVKKWKQDFDSINGGPNRFPKFPLPKNYEFLLSYGIMFNDQEVISHVQLSLSKMMMGGIYDQIGGGFCRYSVDEIWKVPHFEKMLYDNAQLISLYAKGYRYFNNREYKTIVEEIISFCIRELYSKSKLFYAALDADSEGEEGKFYVWKEEELAQILKQEFSLIKKFYCIGNEALWEHDNNILLRNQSISQFARENNITEEELISKLEFAKTTLLSQRSKRVRPSMDDKILLSWNALMIIGLVDAHVSLQNDEYFNLALSATEAILEKNSLHEISKRNFKSKLEREFIFLEDYSLMIEALLKLFEASSNKKYVEIGENYVKFVFENYLDSETNLFYYTSKSQDDLIARKIELQDNVIPSSNSIFANCLHKLYKITGKQKYYDVCAKMLSYNLSQTEEYASSYSNWAILLQKVCKPFHEVVIIGKDAKLAFFEFYSQSIPNTYCFFSETENNELEIFKNRFQTNKTLFYLCTNNSCLPPVDNLLELLNQLKN